MAIAASTAGIGADIGALHLRSRLGALALGEVERGAGGLHRIGGVRDFLARDGPLRRGLLAAGEIVARAGEIGARLDDLGAGCVDLREIGANAAHRLAQLRRGRLQIDIGGRRIEIDQRLAGA